MIFMDWRGSFEFWNLEYDQYNNLFNLKRARKIYIAMKCLLSYHPLLINTSLILANHAKTEMKMFWLCKMLNALLSLHNNCQLPDLISYSSLYHLPSLLFLSNIQMSVTSTSWLHRLPIIEMASFQQCPETQS